MRPISETTERSIPRRAPTASAERPRHRSELLLAGAREAVIEHRGQEYLLRLTSSGKLILTK